MCMIWLKYARLNRKDWFKKYAWYDTGSRHAEEVSGAYSANFNVYHCVTGPL